MFSTGTRSTNEEGLMRSASRRLAGVLAACVAIGLAGGGALEGAAAADVPGAVMFLPKNFADIGQGPVQGPLKHPSRFVIDSADSNLHVRGLRWRGWGEHQATASGLYRWCAPGACSDRWRTYQIRLSDLYVPKGPWCGGTSSPVYLKAQDRYGATSWEAIPFTLC